MGRGYSNSRSKSARPTLCMKRQRSLSLHQLKESMQPPSTAPLKHSAVRKLEVQTPMGDVRHKDSAKRAPTQQRGGSARMRSASTIRQKVASMEKELEGELEPAERVSETIVKPDVMTKYKSAGRALDEVMDILAAACVPGATTKHLCDLGDEELLRRVQAMFSKAKDADGNRILRGLSYPTNVSVNQILCNHAPLVEEEALVLRGGDVVKIHMGCHIDGYPVTAARTVLVPCDATATTSSEISGGATAARAQMRQLTQEAINAVEAARIALHGMIHLMQPGMLNADITDFIHSVGNHFEVQGVEGVLSNRTKRWVPDGMECIITRRVTLEDPHQDVADCNIGANQVWTLDVAFTDHSSYKVAPAEGKASIYRRTEVEFQNDARVRSVHASLQEITEKHQCFPFSLKHLDSPLKARMAVAMLQKQNVIDSLPALRIKGERHITARFSATVAVSERRVTVLCGLPPAEPLVVPDDVRPPPISDGIAAVLSKPLVFAQEGKPQRKKARTEELNK
ncbi:proliferation-associated 2g4 [Trypanosoma rangeli]|uniref:Proliferation-associated 2g4 n=1 Tax=Trypanosoma rangeli TaxID=5698 RepID=A0A3R7KN75_TRYRA|nr:proliferation-associated 2g4 [Trypanosoma rangeli]RNE97944.1 proliferation-associated 2g4 [Trypanosoma rangeli]|eukprot:RNE97944.1 proliferation-associated 2g4 [Trypanosoma rangeli]